MDLDLFLRHLPFMVYFNPNFNGYHFLEVEIGYPFQYDSKKEFPVLLCSGLLGWNLGHKKLHKAII